MGVDKEEMFKASVLAIFNLKLLKGLNLPSSVRKKGMLMWG